MTSFMEFMFCVNRHKRKIILFQCQDGARGAIASPAPPVATPLWWYRLCVVCCFWPCQNHHTCKGSCRHIFVTNSQKSDFHETWHKLSEYINVHWLTWVHSTGLTNVEHTAPELNLGFKKNSHKNRVRSNVENECTIILMYHMKRSVGKFLRYLSF